MPQAQYQLIDVDHDPFDHNDPVTAAEHAQAARESAAERMRRGVYGRLPGEGQELANAMFPVGGQAINAVDAALSGEYGAAAGHAGLAALEAVPFVGKAAGAVAGRAIAAAPRTATALGAGATIAATTGGTSQTADFPATNMPMRPERRIATELSPEQERKIQTIRVYMRDNQTLDRTATSAARDKRRGELRQELQSLHDKDYETKLGEYNTQVKAITDQARVSKEMEGLNDQERQIYGGLRSDEERTQFWLRRESDKRAAEALATQEEKLRQHAALPFAEREPGAYNALRAGALAALAITPWYSRLRGQQLENQFIGAPSRAPSTLDRLLRRPTQTVPVRDAAGRAVRGATREEIPATGWWADVERANEALNNPNISRIMNRGVPTQSSLMRAEVPVGNLASNLQSYPTREFGPRMGPIKTGLLASLPFDATVAVPAGIDYARPQTRDKAFEPFYFNPMGIFGGEANYNLPKTAATVLSQTLAGMGAGEIGGRLSALGVARRNAPEEASRNLINTYQNRGASLDAARQRAQALRDAAAAKRGKGRRPSGSGAGSAAPP